MAAVPQEYNTDPRALPHMIEEGQQILKEMLSSGAVMVDYTKKLIAAKATSPPGESTKALPIFSHTASLDGVNNVSAYTDVGEIKRCMPQHVDNVMVPIIHIHRLRCVELQKDLAKLAEEIGKYLEDSTKGE